MNFSEMTMGSLIGGMIFSSVGFVLFVYGKKQVDFTKMFLGAALMAYPMLVSDTLLVWLTGAALCAAAYYLHDR